MKNFKYYFFHILNILSVLCVCDLLCNKGSKLFINIKYFTLFLHFIVKNNLYLCYQKKNIMQLCLNSYHILQIIRYMLQFF
jgi:hypothetical protein